MRKEILVSLTESELDALISTASQMENDMDYYDFMPKKKHDAFIKAYDNAMEKLRKALFMNVKNKN